MTVGEVYPDIWGNRSAKTGPHEGPSYEIFQGWDEDFLSLIAAERVRVTVIRAISILTLDRAEKADNAEDPAATPAIRNPVLTGGPLITR